MYYINNLPFIRKISQLGFLYKSAKWDSRELKFVDVRLGLEKKLRILFDTAGNISMLNYFRYSEIIREHRPVQATGVTDINNL